MWTCGHVDMWTRGHAEERRKKKSYQIMLPCCPSRNDILHSTWPDQITRPSMHPLWIQSVRPCMDGVLFAYEWRRFAYACMHYICGTRTLSFAGTDGLHCFTALVFRLFSSVGYIGLEGQGRRSRRFEEGRDGRDEWVCVCRC